MEDVERSRGPTQHGPWASSIGPHLERPQPVANGEVRRAKISPSVRPRSGRMRGRHDPCYRWIVSSPWPPVRGPQTPEMSSRRAQSQSSNSMQRAEVPVASGPVRVCGAEYDGNLGASQEGIRSLEKEVGLAGADGVESAAWQAPTVVGFGLSGALEACGGSAPPGRRGVRSCRPDTAWGRCP